MGHAHPGTTHLAGKPLRAQEDALRRALAHHRYVARHGHGRSAAWHRRAMTWTARSLARVEERIVPHGEAELRAYIDDDCLSTIIERETGGTWSPTIDFGFGHGNVNEAYGLPQARPGTKMASAGADWRTNPVTQIRWMRRYVNERYGGSCSALAHHNAVGWY